jgi:signal transduction histidine kinase
VYSGLFLAAATILIVTVNLLLRNMLDDRVADIKAGKPPPVSLPSLPAKAPTNAPTPAAGYHTEVVRAVDDLRDAVLRFQWGVAAVTLAALTVISIIGGWWLAGRILRRLHRITAAAQQLSLSNLHERISLTGPRDELKELADTFDAMLERLERSVDSQRRFVANASHELRTPLAIQRAAIQIGLDDPTPRQLAQVRERLLEANRRTERLMDGLLVLAQSERGLDSREPVALDAVVHQVAGETPADNIVMILDTEPTTVRGDPVLLTRLVANLVQNAVQYNVSGGSVHVSLAATGILIVRNTGPQVPDDRIGELFEPFRRLHATRARSADGAGLGLSIAASIAQAHDATITARPQPAGGLEVTVRLAPDARGSVPEAAPIKESNLDRHGEGEPRVPG